VLTGVAGMSLSRDEFFKKELSFQVSCSYGPGRYDSEYEEAGRDYPVPYVRWTEQRNFEAVLDMLEAGRITARPLVSHRYALGDATSAYELIGSREPSLGVLLNYPAAAEEEVRQTTIRFAASHASVADARRAQTARSPVIGFIGAGGFASRMLLPAFKAEGARLKWVGTRSGLSGAQAARKFGIERATTDIEQILADPETDAVVIATRHDSHSPLTSRALAAGKSVFVEKPLAVNADQLGQVEAAVAAASRASQVLVGFNRRFAPQIVRMASLLRTVDEPKSFIATVNAGAIPADHWTQHPEQGGGRMIGEGCHFLDLLRHLCGHAITDVHAVQLGGRRPGLVCDDKVSVSLTFADGSFGVVHYLANGHRTYPKERIEVFCAERVLQLDNFRRLSGWGWRGFSRMSLWRQDKGHRAEVAAFLATLRAGGPMPIPFHELVEVTRASFAAVESATTGQRVSLIPSAAEPLRVAA
jgi:predicted dehydrogenase